VAGRNEIAGGLTAPMTSFVGRAQELLDVRVLTSRHRLLVTVWLIAAGVLYDARPSRSHIMPASPTFTCRTPVHGPRNPARA
jgi:hypothetical protein